jgi:hypothetical protein
MIQSANATRTGESADATTCVIVYIRNYLNKQYLPWSTDPLEYWLSEKKSGCIRPFIDVVNFVLYTCLRHIGDFVFSCWRSSL